MSEQIKLQAAKEFIQEKNYEIAKSILEQIPESPTAKKWLEKLGDILLSERGGSQVSKSSDFELMSQLDNDEAFKELILRIHKHRWNSNYTSISNIREKLRGLFEDAREDVQRLQRLCVVVRQFNFWYDDDPIIEDFTKLLRSNRYSIRELGAEALRLTNTLAGQRNLWAYPENVDFQDKWGLKIIESEKDIDCVKSYRIVQDGQELFRVRVVRENKKYRTVYPSYETLIEHLHLIALIDQIADRDIDIMIDKELYEQDLRDGWDTYMSEIAPWENDD